MNERKLTKSELAKREDIIMKMKKNKRALVQKYGKDAEAVMYGRATNLAKKQAEAMDQDKIKELVKDALQNPKKADLNKDGKLSDYEKKRGAAIEKNLDEMDLNDPVAMKMRAAKDKLSKMRAANAGDDGNDKFFDAAKLRALKKKRAEIMRDMEQEAEMEGGPIADKYGDMLNKIDRAIDMLSPQKKGDEYMSKDEIERRAAMIGLEEDLDLGHEDNEPHMLKADLYRIGKYAMELYQMVDQFEQGSEEVDFPHWWQSKIIKSKDMLVSAKHYLDFEIKEPQIDAMVDVAQDVEAIDEKVGRFTFPDGGEEFVGDDGEKEDKEYLKYLKSGGKVGLPGMGIQTKDLMKEKVIDEAKFTDYSNKELAAYLKNNPKDKAAAAELKKRSQKLKDLSRTDIKEGVWSLGSINDIKAAIQTMEMGLDMDDTELEQHLQDNDAYFYNVLGDDELHDPLSRAYDQAAMGNEDRAHNELSDAIARAYDLLKMQMEKEQDLARPNTSPFGEIAEKLAQQLKSK